MIPEDNRFESDPTEALPDDPGLPRGWEAGLVDGDDPTPGRAADRAASRPRARRPRMGEWFRGRRPGRGPRPRDARERRGPRRRRGHPRLGQRARPRRWVACSSSTSSTGRSPDEVARGVLRRPVRMGARPGPAGRRRAWPRRPADRHRRASATTSASTGGSPTVTSPRSAPGGR